MELEALGGFGKVVKIRHIQKNTIYACKIMPKIHIITKNKITEILEESHLMSMLNHPFIVPLIQTFQDHYNLYFVMEYFQGRDLRFHINMNKIF